MARISLREFRGERERQGMVVCVCVPSDVQRLRVSHVEASGNGSH
jgi:hypothetical protein